MSDYFVYTGGVDDENHQEAKQQEKIRIDDSVREIPTPAFQRCEKIQALHVPSSVEMICAGAFFKCNLKIVKFDLKNSKLKTIGLRAFNVSTLTSIDIPSSVEVIEEYAFDGCKNLKDIKFDLDNSKLKTIGVGAFSDTSFTTIEIPSSVEEIGRLAFFSGENLKTVKFDLGNSKLRTIGDFAFGRCALTSIEIPSSLEEIGKFAFDNCKNLKDVKFDLENSKLERIRQSAFRGSALTSVDIPSSVEWIGERTFSKCHELKNAKIRNSNLKRICLGTFAGSPLVSFEIPSCVEMIGTRAFAGSSLTTIEIPSSVEVIGADTFANCKNLKAVKFDLENSKLKTIETRAFEGCDLIAVEIPSSVEEIEMLAFSNCRNLKDVKFDLKNSNLKSIGLRAFDESVLAAIRVPSPSEIIGSGAYFCHQLRANEAEKISIDESVLKIPMHAFQQTLQQCQSLQTIHIDSAIEAIGMGAFANRKKLNAMKFDLENSKLKTIGTRAFAGSSLATIEIPSSVTVIGEKAFHDCQNLITIQIPASVEVIGAYAFANCRNLKDVKFELENSNLKTIDTRAFAETALTTIEIPSSIEEIGKYAFNSCKNLLNINVDIESKRGSLDVLYGAFSDTSISRFHPIFYLHLDEVYIENVFEALYQFVPIEGQDQIMLDRMINCKFSNTEFLAIDEVSKMTILHAYTSLGPNRTGISTLKYLLSMVPNSYLEKKDKFGHFPLHKACISGVSDTKVLELLIPTRMDALKKGKNSEDAPLALGIRHGKMSEKALVFLYSFQPISNIMVQKIEEAKLNHIKKGYVQHIKQEFKSEESFSGRRKHAWVDFVNSHLENDDKLTDELVSFLKSKESCSRETLLLLAHAKDCDGKEAITVATSKIKEAFQSRLCKFGRYDIENEEHPVHRSKTCIVFFAIDTKKDVYHPDRRVAIKIMENKTQFYRELKQRLRPGNWMIDDDIAENSNKFHKDHVVPLLRYHEPTEQETHRCIVMPRGERNLDYIIRNERIAGHDIDAIVYFAVDIAKALAHLHEENIVHLDFKPRNIVRIHGSYKLIDFDASTAIGEPLTEKFSSGYIPPEVARVKFRPTEDKVALEERIGRLEDEIMILKKKGDRKGRREKDAELAILEERLEQFDSPVSDEILRANIQMDIWSYGIVLYQMVTNSDGLFRCDQDDNLRDEHEQNRLKNWEGITHEDLQYVLCKCKCDEEYIESAKDLLLQCLNADPQKRPKNMKEILKHPFIKRSNVQLHKKLDKMEKNLLDEMMESQKSLRDVKQNQENVMIKQEEMHQNLHTIMSNQEELKQKNESMQKQLGRSIQMTRSLLADIAAPKYFFIVPEGFSFVEMFNVVNTVVNRKAKLYFVCPVTFSVPRDSDGKPMGYDLELKRNWVEKIQPALYVSLIVLQMASAVGRLAGLPLPNKIDDLFCSKSDKYFFASIADEVVARKDGEALGNPLGELEKHQQLRVLARRSYEEVKKLAYAKGDPEFLQSGLSRVVSDAGSTEYVLNAPKIKALYAKEGASCLGLSADQLGEKGADLHKIVVEGLLEKKSNRGSSWKPRYFILRKNGLLSYYHSKEYRDEDTMGVKGKITPERVVEIGLRDDSLIAIQFADSRTRDFKVPSDANTPREAWIQAGKVLAAKNEF